MTAPSVSASVLLTTRFTSHTFFFHSAAWTNSCVGGARRRGDEPRRP